jgi:hypothetical protein
MLLLALFYVIASIKNEVPVGIGLNTTGIS